MHDDAARSVDRAPALLHGAALCFAFAAAVLAGGVAYFGWDATLAPSSPDFIPLPAGFAAALALFGVLNLAQGLVARARRRRFGAATLEAGPARLGRRFSGKIRTVADIPASGPFRLSLTCTRTIRSEDDEGRTRRTSVVLWKGEARAPASTRSGASGIPFAFDIPADGLPSAREGQPENETIAWDLVVTAPAQGLGFEADFIVEMGGTGGPADSGKAFAGLPRPESAGARIVRIAAGIGGPVLVAAGLYGTLGQIVHTAGGHRQAGEIVAVRRPGLEVRLDDRALVGVAYVTRNTAWREGQRVELVCAGTPAVPNRCRMATHYDRWIDGVGTLVVGLAVAGLALFLHRRRGRIDPAGGARSR